MLETLKEMFTSKKFIASVAGTIVAAVAKIGLDLPVEDVATVLSPIVAYILGQGWADSGKVAAKVAALSSAVGDSNRAEIKSM